ncbi:fungal transcriptional regulatory [Fusarium albosuccineum]|uniref:Fungal transcriptional regulatory n=1 Tax=Fusarium albosuccineum TaxID=1237068 RepID=A0A8H4LN62_9HYPO|nr:fungal transcriptional regulatory [Fusarium albosuccineum]
MFYFIYVILFSAWLVDASAHSVFHSDLEQASRLFARQGRQGRQSCLDPALIQSASAKTGQEPGTEGIKPGQAPSATDANNFINFCKGQQITNGAQVKSGSCNPIPMGKIPATSNMVSAMITSPQAGEPLTAGTTFNVEVQTTHLRAGNFVNPTTNYYTAPQDLDQNGDIIGHCHVTIQDIGSLKSTVPPDPSRFAFFKGIDDDGNGQGLLQAVVEGGLPAGVYRVCTMIAAQNHQPVTMPVAQRGAQDDCTKFEVVDGQGGGGGAATPGNQNQQNGTPTGQAPAAGSQPARGGFGGRGRGKGFRRPGQRGQQGRAPQL